MICFFFFKQKTAYEMRMSDWSSDVCSSDLVELLVRNERPHVVALVEARTDLDLLRAIRNRSEYLVERRLVYIETGASRADLTLIVENACSRTRARSVKISVGQPAHGRLPAPFQRALLRISGCGLHDQPSHSSEQRCVGTAWHSTCMYPWAAVLYKHQ